MTSTGTSEVTPLILRFAVITTGRVPADSHSFMPRITWLRVIWNACLSVSKPTLGGVNDVQAAKVNGVNNNNFFIFSFQVCIRIELCR